MSSDAMIMADGLGKCYRMYSRPHDRLKEGALSMAASFFPRFRASLSQRAKACGRDFWALQNASFSVARGETVGIVGRNGSGKSTLLQLICGTLCPTAGSVNTRGRVAALLELGAGFNPEFTGRENVFLNAQLLGLTRQQVTERFDSIAEFAEIGPYIDQPVKSYSSGMFVRLAFAVIVHVDADILVIDEALAVGDAYFTQKCMRFLHDFMSRGTVLFVSHDIASVKALAQRSIWLEDGQVRMIGPTREIADRYLEALYAQNQVIDSVGHSDCKAAVAAVGDDVYEPHEDFRLPLLMEGGLENHQQVARFNPDSRGFGDGKAVIRDVRLLDPAGLPRHGIQGGERVILEINVDVEESLETPIVGFFVRNRLGQNVFGDNSYLTSGDAPRFCPKGCCLVGRFEFVMPFLPRGDYAISVAIASGSNVNHVQHQWLHDAVVIKSLASNVHADVIGVPMARISLDVLSASSRNVG